MEITLAQAQNIMSSPIFGMRLPAANSFKFAQLGKLLGAELKTADEERQKLIESCHGVLSEDKTQFTFAPEDAPAFATGMESLMSAPIEIGAFWPIDLEKLGSIELSANEMMQLEPLITIAE